MTNRSKILNIMKEHGYITKAIAANEKLSYGLGDHISKLKAQGHIIVTTMLKSTITGKRFAMYDYKGKR